MRKTQVVAGLAALAQETRLAIFRLLVDSGAAGLSAGRIAAALGVPAATLSFHLKELTNAGIVTRRRKGRSMIYAADFGTMGALAEYLLENCCARSAPATQRRPLRAARPRGARP